MEELRKAVNLMHDVLSGKMVSCLENQDPAGRLDVLASRIVERVAMTSPNPAVKEWFLRGKPLLDAELNRRLGPAQMPRTRRKEDRRS